MRFKILIRIYRKGKEIEHFSSWFTVKRITPISEVANIWMEEFQKLFSKIINKAIGKER